ncbi:cell wall-associated hydrolase [Embleya hyalina]|uniref:Cell wall-associated hydrolase n=2 Tax=Embleya hyalina TaxID=516124 RepID=A0A401YQX3_9ACTN|nr:cell wall-associated hydrolase [Embleya hyalina]
MDPKSSAKLFYARLIALPNWESLPLTIAAQKVQISAFPEAYAKWEKPANQIVGAIEGVKCRQVALAPMTPKQESTVIGAAMKQVGVAYSWGGGNATGQSYGIKQDAKKMGFDCSGLALYAYAQIGVTLPHNTQEIWRKFQPVITDQNSLRPGDLLLLGYGKSTSQIHHVGIYLGDGAVVEAPHSGAKVRVIRDVFAPGAYYASEFVGAVRPGSRSLLV